MSASSRALLMSWIHWQQDVFVWMGSSSSNNIIWESLQTSKQQKDSTNASHSADSAPTQARIPNYQATTSASFLLESSTIQKSFTLRKLSCGQRIKKERRTRGCCVSICWCVQRLIAGINSATSAPRFDLNTDRRFQTLVQAKVTTQGDNPTYPRVGRRGATTSVREIEASTLRGHAKRRSKFRKHLHFLCLQLFDLGVIN